MAQIPSSVSVQLTTNFQTVFANNSGLSLTVGLFRICNVTGGAITVTVCIVPTGGSPDITNSALWQTSLAANAFLEFAQGEIVRDGETVQAKASANTSIVMRVVGNAG